MRNLRPIAVLITLALGSVPAHAGQSPFVAAAGDECALGDFYLSPKHQQFTYGIDAALASPEYFVTTRGIGPAPEQCNVDFLSSVANQNWHLPNRDVGAYSWLIQLPQKPQSSLEIVLQCGLLKPNTELFGVLLCGGESGERVDSFCERDFLFDQPGLNPGNPSWMPTVRARALTPDSSMPAFQLTAYLNPSDYELTTSLGATTNSSSLGILDGSTVSRVQLKSCMDKVVVVKLPVAGQLNTLGQVEFELEALDLIEVVLTFPRGHSMDVYCHAQSAQIRGLGDPQTLVAQRCGP